MHPVGPRSSRVYWFRRLTVGVLALVVVGGIVWYVVHKAGDAKVDTAAETAATSGSMTGVLATSSPAPDTSMATAASRAASTSAASAGSSTSSGSSTSASTAATTKADTSKVTPKRTSPHVTSSSAAGTSATSTSPSTKSAATKTAASTSASTTAGTTTKATAHTTAKSTTRTSTKTTPKPTTPPPPSTDAQGRLICSDAAISVVATTGSPTFPVGSKPLLGLTVTNVGSVPCVRDLSGPLQVFTVHTTKGARVWSTADCFPGTGTDVRQLAPGATVSYTIRWSGTTSQPGCTGQRLPVPAGAYTLTASVGTAVSKPTAFSITG